MSTLTSRCRRPVPSPGVTVIEIGAVLGLAALLLALSTPLYFNFVRERRVVRATEDLVGLLRTAQQRAVADSVDACGVQVVILGTHAEVRRVPRTSGVCQDPVTFRKSEPFPSGVQVDAVTVEFTNAGSLAAASPDSFVVASGSRRRTVSVNATTGRVEITP